MTGRRSPSEADALVIFGITGDLARKMTFEALYRLERRHELNCPVLGVAIDDLSDDGLRAHARASIEDAGEAVDEKVMARLAKRLTYVQGDYGKDETYTRLAKELQGKKRPTFYLETPPSLFLVGTASTTSRARSP